MFFISEIPLLFFYMATQWYMLLKESSVQFYIHFREAPKSLEKQTPLSPEMNDNERQLSRLLYYLPTMCLTQHWAGPVTIHHFYNTSLKYSQV